MDRNIALTELGMISDTQPNKTNTGHFSPSPEDNVVQLSPGKTASHENLDHFSQRDGLTFAGMHLVIDLWGASRLDEIDHIDAALREAVEVSGATLLHIHLHHFTPNGGVSGVAVLAESHISIHTWPELDYAALDVFMCGDAEPVRTIDVLKRAFTPDKVQLTEIKRGLIV